MFLDPGRGYKMVDRRGRGIADIIPARLFGMVFLGASTYFTGETISMKVARPWLLLTRTGINILSWVT